MGLIGVEIWIPLVVGTLAFGLLARLLAFQAHQHRHCPTCDLPYEVVAGAGDGPNTSYDVLACPQCANCATLVHGARRHHAYCPACGNAALETAASRADGDGLRVDVKEHCALCGFQHQFTVGEPVTAVKMGKVLPFPKRRDDAATKEA